MDPSIFEVEHPVVLPGDRPGSSIWQADVPAALLVAALSGPDVAVVAAGLPDLRLPILAALLGSRVAVLTEDATALESVARLNDVHLRAVTTWPDDVDVVIAPAPPLAQVPGAVLLRWRPVELQPGHVRIDVVGGEVRCGEPISRDVPHLVVPSERVEDVGILVKQAADAQGHSRPAGLANHAAATALRLAEQIQSDARRERELAAADVARAYEQMRDAREELRGVRGSRSWRYTRLLRRITDR